MYNNLKVPYCNSFFCRIFLENIIVVRNQAESHRLADRANKLQSLQTTSLYWEALYKLRRLEGYGFFFQFCAFT